MALTRNVNAIRLILSEMLIDPHLDQKLLIRELQTLRDDIARYIEIARQKVVDTPGSMG